MFTKFELNVIVEEDRVFFFTFLFVTQLIIFFANQGKAFTLKISWQHLFYWMDEI